MKFVQDAKHFNTPASRVGYLINCTSGEAQDQLLTRLRSKVLAPVHDVKEAFEYLEMLYRDPELRTTDHELPEEEWSQNLHEYLQLKLDIDIGEFSTYEDGTSKEVAKQVYLRLLRQGWEDGEGVDKI
ncbi:uncharacterized protein BDV14DRAFT_208623 [Aspergillus stella-maris]|uniref:uncharacterized protein n=1 Tax=Aspergillus stella-maris TaxID=1810926 RepID=UPI003CCE05AF